MRILFLSDLLAYGGASKLIYDLLPRMQERGNQCELLILTDEHSKYLDDLRRQGVAVNVVPRNIHGHISKILYIKKWIQNGQYDVIHANLFPMTYYCSIVKRILGKKCPCLVMTEHSTDNKRRHKAYLRHLEQFIYKKYDHVISISDKTQENLCLWLKTSGDFKFSVIENGIDVDLFRNAPKISRKELYTDYKDGDTLLLTVGSFTPQKNHKNLVKALTFLPDNYKLIFCGEGPLEKEIKQQVTENNLSNRVVFLGFRKDIANIMHSVDILVIPSLWEGFGLIAAEGMACGLPICASDVPGLSEVVGDAGIKFNPNDQYNIATAIETLGENKVKEICINNGYKKSDLYNIKTTVSKYCNLYEQIHK